MQSVAQLHAIHIYIKYLHKQHMSNIQFPHIMLITKLYTASEHLLNDGQSCVAMDVLIGTFSTWV